MHLTVLTFMQKDKSTPTASLPLPSLTCGPKSSDSPSTFNRLHPFFHGGCPGGEDDGGGGEGDERGVAAREHHHQLPGAPPPVPRRGTFVLSTSCLFFYSFFAIYFNQYQWCYIIGVDGGFV